MIIVSLFYQKWGLYWHVRTLVTAYSCCVPLDINITFDIYKSAAEPQPSLFQFANLNGFNPLQPLYVLNANNIELRGQLRHFALQQLISNKN